MNFVKQIPHLYEQKIQRNCDNNSNDGIRNVSHWSGDICVSTWFKDDLESGKNSDFCNRYFYNLWFNLMYYNTNPYFLIRFLISSDKEG